jgi:hypothetical protein
MARVAGVRGLENGYRPLRSAQHASGGFGCFDAPVVCERGRGYKRRPGPAEGLAGVGERSWDIDWGDDVVGPLGWLMARVAL